MARILRGMHYAECFGAVYSLIDSITNCSSCPKIPILIKRAGKSKTGNKTHIEYSR